MKKCFCALALVTMTALLFIGCAGEKFSDASLEKYMKDVEPYIVGLNADDDPGSIKAGEYSALIKQGKVVHMWGPETDGTKVQDLNDPQVKEIADKLFAEYSTILPIAQECLESGYCSKPSNDPYAVVLYDIKVFLTEEGVACFPDSDRIARITVTVKNRRAEQNTDGAVLVQKTYLKPRGLRICIDYKDGTTHDFGYGEAYDYAYEEDK